jgi:hypothetical protein
LRGDGELNNPVGFSLVFDRGGYVEQLVVDYRVYPDVVLFASD